VPYLLLIYILTHKYIFINLVHYTTIQARARGNQVRSVLQTHNNAATTIQACFRKALQQKLVADGAINKPSAGQGTPFPVAGLPRSHSDLEVITGKKRDDQYNIRGSKQSTQSILKKTSSFPNIPEAIESELQPEVKQKLANIKKDIQELQEKRSDLISFFSAIDPNFSSLMRDVINLSQEDQNNRIRSYLSSIGREPLQLNINQSSLLSPQ
jgi:hypothetical protein